MRTYIRSMYSLHMHTLWSTSMAMTNHSVSWCKVNHEHGPCGLHHICTIVINQQCNFGLHQCYDVRFNCSHCNTRQWYLNAPMNVMYTVHPAPIIWETCTAVLYTHLNVNLTVLNVTHVTVYIYIFIRYIMHLYEVANIHAHTAEQNINDSWSYIDRIIIIYVTRAYYYIIIWNW